jgi:Arc/MetJ-type ribon-helix-helix transcriptional regulator
MPSKLPRLNVVMPQSMRDWLEAQRLPCESASHVVRRLINDAMSAAVSRSSAR